MNTHTGTDVAFANPSEKVPEGSRPIIAGSSGHDLFLADKSPVRASGNPVTPIVRDNSLSFETLVRRLAPTLKRITCRLNGNFSFADDQDLFQEALIHLWTHFASGDLLDKTDSYMLQGCYFHLKNYIRKIQDPAALCALNQAADKEGPQLEDILDARSLDSYDEVEGNLQIEAMAGIGITQREKAVLRFCLEGMTTREIGKRLGISHVSVVKIRNSIREKYIRLNG